jgi:hypothetical protein
MGIIFVPLGGSNLEMVSRDTVYRNFVNKAHLPGQIISDPRKSDDDYYEVRL